MLEREGFWGRVQEEGMGLVVVKGVALFLPPWGRRGPALSLRELVAECLDLRAECPLLREKKVLDLREEVHLVPEQLLRHGLLPQ